MKATHKLTVYLIKKDITSFEKCLETKSIPDTDPFTLRKDLGIEGIIFLGKTKSKDPKWESLLQQGTDEVIPGLLNSSNRAILFIRHRGRIFALTFGYGQYLLRASVIERNFGLKTSLNSINPEKLRSIDSAKLDELTVQTRTQSSVTASREAFQIDVIGDLIRSITGETSDQDLGKIITGSDAVYINPKIEFSDIPGVLTELYRNYKKSNYKNGFDWIDNLMSEKNPDVIEELDKLILQELKLKNTSKVSLAPPFIVDWKNYSGISFTKNGELFNFDIEKYYEERNTDDLDIEKLKRVKIYLEESANENRIPLNLYDCINFQAEYDDNLYVHTLGNWYKIDKVYANRIINYVRRIKQSTTECLTCQEDWDEEEYNINLADSSRQMTLFDRKKIRCESTRTDIEACDVLTSSGEFIHIKVGNTSATLSHLFSQGRISALAFINDMKFREEMRNVISSNGDFNKNVIPTKKPFTGDFTITYAIITNKDKPIIEILPFFSLLNLRQSAQYLVEHGFEVRIKKILKL